MLDLTPLVQAVISLVAVLVTAFLIPWLKRKLSAERQAELADWIAVAVSAAEQIYSGPGRGAEKKEYVLAFLESKGYRLDASGVLDSINALIEAAVYGLKNP